MVPIFERVFASSSLYPCFCAKECLCEIIHSFWIVALLKVNQTDIVKRIRFHLSVADLFFDFKRVKEVVNCFRIISDVPVNKSAIIQRFQFAVFT